MMSNSPRGEAQTYPKIQDELYDWSINSAAAGSNLIVASADDACVAWGVPVSGKLGLEAMATTTRVPKFVDSVRGLVTTDVSCGYGHVCFVVTNHSSESVDIANKYPRYPNIPNDTNVGAKRKGGSGSLKSGTKKGRK